ncbi:uncharacterized protein LOC113316567 [Papaver somniferum]|uniref:uncharacterized protein LOC113316567 n=1 Tax=Papaver somniferum TaxID=3469 RepID=UPI000E6F7504|nr:uncharacterized protein LOC113316567 [Papaver somniferum]
MGFNDSWCQKIMQCISTTTSVVLINGSPDSFFTPYRGLRQGDPLSHYLFLFCMEAPSRTLIHAEELGIISGIKICKGAPSINHLMFVDDHMVFCKANKIEDQNLMDILNLFRDTSGQLINFIKPGVFISRNTDPTLILQFDDIYLGSPLFTHRSKIKSFILGVDNMKLRLSSWKNAPLNPAGREVLIKTVTSTTSIYLNTISRNGEEPDYQEDLTVPHNLNLHNSQDFGFIIKIRTIQDPGSFKFFSVLTI